MNYVLLWCGLAAGQSRSQETLETRTEPILLVLEWRSNTGKVLPPTTWLRMTTERIGECQSFILHDGDEKYIIAKIKNHETKNQRLVLVSYPLKYHSMIAREFEEKLERNETMTVMGGGILIIDRKKKTIKTYGQSGGFGAPKVGQVKQILQNSQGFEDYDLDITVTDYIRD